MLGVLLAMTYSLHHLYFSVGNLSSTNKHRLFAQIFSSVLICWQLKLEGIHVDEEKTINDPELLMEVIVFIVFLISFIYPVKNTQSIFIKHPMQLWIVMTPSKMKTEE